MAELAEKTETAAAVPEEAAAGTTAVKTVELTKRFGKTVALAGLTMTVPRGEVFGFLGPNGAGKTTAVKLLLGLLRRHLLHPLPLSPRLLPLLPRYPGCRWKFLRWRKRL